MQERTLLTISLITIILGLPSLILLSLYLEKNLNNPENIILENDPDIILNGKIIKISKNSKFTSFTLKYESVIPVILFEETDLKQGDNIKLKAELDNYNGKKQLVASKIY